MTKEEIIEYMKKVFQDLEEFVDKNFPEQENKD